jgi:hypothetical protein
MASLTVELSLKMNQRFDMNYSLTRFWFLSLMTGRCNCECSDDIILCLGVTVVAQFVYMVCVTNSTLI